MTRTAWGGDDSVMNDPLKALGNTCCIYDLHPYWALPMVTFPPTHKTKIDAKNI
jgi:hypothetical protein